MKKKNIYKLDSLLIYSGIFLLVIVILTKNVRFVEDPNEPPLFAVEAKGFITVSRAATIEEAQLEYPDAVIRKLDASKKHRKLHTWFLLSPFFLFFTGVFFRWKEKRII